MASKLGKRSRSKSYYGAKRQRMGGLEQLSTGMRGVLITTGDREKLCVSEAYSLLNEYADKLYGPEDMGSQEGESESGEDESSEGKGNDDIEAAVAKEIEQLKGSRGGKGGRTERRFQAVNTGAKHVVFIKCQEEVDPSVLVHHILSDIVDSGVKKSRFCQRILPVTKVCRATVSDLREQAESVLEPHFHTDSVTVHKFAVNYKARNNHDVKREEIIKLMAAMVTKNGDYEHKVDLSNPDLTVIVEIIKNLCCLSVVKDFVKLKRYNLQSLASPEEKSTQTADSAVTTTVASRDTAATTATPENAKEESDPVIRSDISESCDEQATPTVEPTATETQTENTK